MTRPALLDNGVVQGWITAHPAWRVEESRLIRDFEFVDYASGVRLLQAQVELANRLDHHPIVTLGFRRARFELWTHDRGGLTQLDLDYAGSLDSIVTEQFDDVVR